MNKYIINQINSCFEARNIEYNASMAKYSSLKLGGNADVLINITHYGDIIIALKIAKAHNLPVNVIGNASNILVLEKGLRGICLRLSNDFAEVEQRDNCVLYAKAGCSLQALSSKAQSLGFAGLSFASGIPGTAGGAVIMNAGAYGPEMKDVVLELETINSDGVEHVFTNEEMKFGYRTSALQGKGFVVKAISYKLSHGNPEDIAAISRDLNKRRAEKQPLNLPSCGSTFKRPVGAYASALIDQCGLRGFRVGGCAVSEKHCGFLVNDQNGTIADYLQLISQVQSIVKNKTGYNLELELKILGDL